MVIDIPIPVYVVLFALMALWGWGLFTGRIRPDNVRYSARALRGLVVGDEKLAPVIEVETDDDDPPAAEAVEEPASETGPSFLAVRLQRAGISTITEQQLVLMMLTAGLAVAGTIYATLGAWLLALGWGVIAGGVPLFYLNVEAGKRRLRIEAQIMDATFQMISKVDSGIALHSALSDLAESTPDPLGTEFRKILLQIKGGTSIEDALHQNRKLLALDSFSMLIDALALHNQFGGSLKTVLEEVYAILRARTRLRQTLRAEMAKPTGQYLIVLSLGLLMTLLLIISYPEHVLAFYTALSNQALVLGMLAWSYVGYWLIKRFGDLDKLL